MRRPWLLVTLILLVGLAGTVVALKSREGNAQLISQQQGLLAVDAPALQRLILTTSDPRPGYGGRARAARCTSGAATALGNPWACTVRYPRPPSIRYEVTVHADRSIYGLGRTVGVSSGTALTVRGCCVGSP